MARLPVPTPILGINFHFCLAIFLLGIGSMDAGIIQSPKYSVKEQGQEVTLSCQQNLNHDYMYWYRQDDDEGLQTMFYFNNKELFGNFTKSSHYKPSREDDKLILQIKPLQYKDTAIYFCASSYGTGAGQLHFGAGTKLTVVDDLTKVTPPKVTVFQPSEEEIEKKGKATLVCLATGFYPDLVELTWWVNGKETKIGVSTDPQPSKEDPISSFSYYSLSSRLRVSAPFWRNPKNSFRCQVQFYGISENEIWTSSESKPVTQNVSDQTWGRADCGVTSESYQRSIQSATFFYEILLGKAMLYGLLVSILVWRTRSKNSS